MQGTIIERPLKHFVGLRVVGTYDTLSGLMPEARKTLLSRQFSIEGIEDPDTQICVTKPNEIETNADNVTSYIGFEVSAETRSAPAEMIRIELPSGRYARFEWRGSLLTEEFEGFYPGIFAWLKEGGLSPSERSPWIEVYGPDYNWENRADSTNRLTVLMPLGGVGR